jgi:NADPH2:quinone reductase
VRVAIRSAGVNFHDTYCRSGLYPNTLPITNGCEGAGIITEVGPHVDEFVVGDRVAFFEYNCAYATEAQVPATSCFKLPDSLPFDIGAAVLVQGLTAHYLATDSFALGPGKTCVVHAAGGGTGALLVQIAKILGATVIGTASRGAKAEAARAAGADHVIAYDDSYLFLPELLSLCPDGVHCVYDSIGLKTTMQSLEALRARGTCVLFGNSSGKPPPLDATPTLAARSLYVHRPVLQHFLATRQERERRSSQVFDWLAQGRLSVRIARKFRLEEAADAHRFLESRAALGKVLLTTDSELHLPLKKD